jgi:predicted nucleotidyltransferase
MELSSQWQFLPTDIIERIFLNISDYYTHLSMMKTCKKLYFLAQQNQFELLKKFAIYTVGKMCTNNFNYIQAYLLPNSIRHGYYLQKFMHCAESCKFYHSMIIYNCGFKIRALHYGYNGDILHIYYKNIQLGDKLIAFRNYYYILRELAHKNYCELKFSNENCCISPPNFKNIYLPEELRIEKSNIIFKWYNAKNKKYELILRIKNNCVDKIEWQLHDF